MINGDLAAPTRKKKLQFNTTSLKLDTTETEFNERKNFSPIICKLDAPVSNEAVEGSSSKPSGVDFDIVIDKLPNKSLPAVQKLRTLL